jgi:hypothetical protein
LNPQGSSLARVRVGCRRQSACPSVMENLPHQSSMLTLSSTGGRSRTSNRRLNRAPPYRWATPVSRFAVDRSGCTRPGIWMAGFEPAISCSRSRRIEPGFPPSRSECPAGFEPALPPWQGGRLPLHHGHCSPKPNGQGNRAPGGTRTHVAALRVRSPGR